MCKKNCLMILILFFSGSLYGMKKQHSQTCEQQQAVSHETALILQSINTMAWGVHNQIKELTQKVESLDANVRSLDAKLDGFKQDMTQYQKSVSGRLIAVDVNSQIKVTKLEKSVQILKKDVSDIKQILDPQDLIDESDCSHMYL